jgi:hypothetical protein
MAKCSPPTKAVPKWLARLVAKVLGLFPGARHGGCKALPCGCMVAPRVVATLLKLQQPVRAAAVSGRAVLTAAPLSTMPCHLADMVSLMYGRQLAVDTSRITQELGAVLMPPSRSWADMAQRMLDLGAIKPRRTGCCG